ncbi:MAG: OmpA family protein [Acidobacteria bacterium]|nr:MAG: OmpA family protein [Acidobacteriota bacterium]
MRKTLTAAVLLVFAVGGGTACATKKYVNTQVTGVNSKVDTLSKSVEDTQQRTRQNEDKIAGVDQKVGVAQQAANQAQNAANNAGTKADAANAAAAAAAAKAEEVDRASKRLTYTVTIDDSQGNFKLNSAKLPDEARAKLDELIAKVKADPQGAYFEIEGYTDSTGDPAVNQKLGLARAEAVREYLYKQHQIPLHRMNVISYGEDNPVAKNNTKEGRAQNRRVVIKVLI